MAVIDIPLLSRQIEETLKQPKSADREVAVRRQLGLRLLITTRDGQSAADVQAALERFSSRFTVEPLFPASTFQVAAPGTSRHWSDSVFLAMVYEVAFADVTANGWDLAREVRRVGGFVSVSPELPITAPAARDQEEAGSAGEPGESWGWERAAMHIQEAWNVVRAKNRAPGENVTIGHPDCGYREHPIWNYGTNNLDRKRGRSFWPNEDLYDATERPGAEYPGHGLATASVMVSPLPPREGTVTGVAPGALLLPIRCNDTVKIWFTTESIVTRAVRYAMEQKCRVISISMGGLYELFGPHPLGPLYQTIKEAIDADIIVVAASGQFLFPLYPTVIPANGWRVIGVAGIEKTTQRYQAWGHSCRTPYGSITVSAPARTVTKAAINDGYDTSEGTSYAAAFVAGVAALWLSYFYYDRYPDKARLRAAECFRNHLLATRWLPQGFDPWFGGIIDAHRLVVTKPNPDGERQDEISSATTVVGMLSEVMDPEDPGGFEKLVLETLGSGLPEPQNDGTPSKEELVIEIGSILAHHPGALTEVVRLRDAGALSAQSLATLLAPQASTALKGRLGGH